MDSTYVFGSLLVGLSAFFLATHWQQWRDPNLRDSCKSQKNHPRARDYKIRTTRRRAVASSLVGIVGFTLMAFNTVPRTPLSITAYLLVLVLMACWVLWLALVDLFATRRFHQDEQIDQIASELRREEREKTTTNPSQR